MMRMQSGIIFALASSFAFVLACADSGTQEPDDMNDDDQQTQNVCGDGTCAAAEVGYCQADCGAGGNGGNNNATCGDGMCETTKGENGASCAVDCGGGGGTGSGGGGGGTSTTCPSDPLECFGCLLDMSLCPAGLDQNTCTTCLTGGLGGGTGGGTGGGFGDLLCEGGAPDGTCNANAGEDSSTCPSDCP